MACNVPDTPSKRRAIAKKPHSITNKLVRKAGTCPLPRAEMFRLRARILKELEEGNYWWGICPEAFVIVLAYRPNGKPERGYPTYIRLLQVPEELGDEALYAPLRALTPGEREANGIALAMLWAMGEHHPWLQYSEEARPAFTLMKEGV